MNDISQWVSDISQDLPVEALLRVALILVIAFFAQVLGGRAIRRRR